MELQPIEIFSECITFFMVIQELMLYTEQKISTHKRIIFFFSRYFTHLTKTLWNCLFNSGSGRFTRYMWNREFFLLWSHISRFYYEDLDCCLKLVKKLTSDHINLVLYSVMRVNLATNVLSETVGNISDSSGSK